LLSPVLSQPLLQLPLGRPLLPFHTVKRRSPMPSPCLLRLPYLRRF